MSTRAVQVGCVLLTAAFVPGAPLARFVPVRREAAVPPAVAHASTASHPQPAKGRFLVASRNLGDPNFGESVVLLFKYDTQGAMGVIINRPTQARVASTLPNVPELRDRPDRVFFGGPVVASVMLVLLRSAKPPAAAERVFGDVYASGSLKALRQVLRKPSKANRLRAYVGYAGWGPGQLDHEIARGDWYVADADAATIFEAKPSEIWPKLIDRVSGRWTWNHALRWRSGHGSLLSGGQTTGNHRPETRT